LVLDDMSAGCRANLPEDAEVIEASVLDRRALASLFNGNCFDWVFHLAASFANSASVEDPDHDLAVNALGTLRLAEQIVSARQAARVKALVYTSTSCVYCNCRGAVSETAPTNPGTPYAASKLLGEHYLQYVSRAHGLPLVVLRLFNVYGPGEYPTPQRGVITRFIRAALSCEPLVITGSGSETRDFTFVDDAVTAILAAAARSSEVPQTYNVGTGRRTRIKDVAHAIVRLTGSSSRVVYEPRRAWDVVAHRQADISRAQRGLGFRATTLLQEGLPETVGWLYSVLRSADMTTPVVAGAGKW